MGVKVNADDSILEFVLVATVAEVQDTLFILFPGHAGYIILRLLADTHPAT